MSDHDSDNPDSIGTDDRISSCPQYSQLDSTLDLTHQSSCHPVEPNNWSLNDTDLQNECTSTTRRFDITKQIIPPANQDITRRGVVEDYNISGPAPKTGMLAVNSHAPDLLGLYI